MSSLSGSFIVDLIFSDLPQVHVDLGNPDGGVWRTERACYELIANRCHDQSMTLETGLGLSTVLFTRIGTHHTCIAPWKSEVEKMFSYFQEKRISTDRLTIIQGFSDKVLPMLPSSELDLVLIDGGHGFPTPIIDWYFAGGRLREGGTLVIDDVHLPAVRALLRYIDTDKRWKNIAVTEKWVAYERLGQGSLREEHTEQASLSFDPINRPPKWVSDEVAERGISRTRAGPLHKPRSGASPFSTHGHGGRRSDAC